MAVKPKNKFSNPLSTPGGGSRGTGMGGRGTKGGTPLTEPKSGVKVVPATTPGLRKVANDSATLKATRAKSGQAAKTAAAAREQNMKTLKKKAFEARKAKAASMDATLMSGGRLAITKKPAKSPMKNGVRVIKGK